MKRQKTQREREVAAALKIAAAITTLRRSRRCRYDYSLANSSTMRALRLGISMSLGCDTTEQENRRIGELLKVTE